MYRSPSVVYGGRSRARTCYAANYCVCVAFWVVCRVQTREEAPSTTVELVRDVEAVIAKR